MKIRHKIILTIVAASVFFNLIFGIYQFISERSEQYQRLNSKIENTNELIKSIIIGPLWDVDIPRIYHNINLIYNDPEIYRIDLKDVTGIINISLKKKTEIGLNEIIKKKITITRDNHTLGEIELYFSTKSLKKALNTIIFETITLTVGFVILYIFIISIISGILLKPIDKIVGALQQVDQGIYDFKLELNTNDEFHQIEEYFNRMVATINKEIKTRELNEKELRFTQNFLNNVFNSIPSMLISINKKGIITQWNSAAEKITGISRYRAITQNIWELLPFLSKYKNSISNVFEKNVIEEFHKQDIQLNEKKFLDISISPLIFNGNSGVVIRIDDVTDFEKKDEQLRQAQKMEIVGTLAGGLAHDFNNVLSGILGSISIIKHKIKKDGKISDDLLKKYITMIETSGDRARDMVQHLLTLSRKQELSLTRVDLNSTIKHVMKICCTFDKSIDLQPKYYPKPAYIEADPTQIEQVILNLCINSSHAMTIMKEKETPQGGTLTVSIADFFADDFFCSTHPEATQQTYWVISVSDTGIGMNKKTVAKIFDPFYTTKEKGKGTGLGLAMVYNNIHRHNGFIDVYSEKGVGTTFCIYLPVLTHKINRKIEIKKDVELPQGTGLILIVDDEEIIRQLAGAILIDCGYDVIYAENGEEGIELFKKHHDEIKLVLMDMIMPKKSGYESFLEIKKIDKDIKVILSSGFKQDERVNSVMKLGVQEFIQKPYSYEKLANAVWRVLNKK